MSLWQSKYFTKEACTLKQNKNERGNGVALLAESDGEPYLLARVAFGAMVVNQVGKGGSQMGRKIELSSKRGNYSS